MIAAAPLEINVAYTDTTVPEALNILLVDDHAENLIALESVLAELGHNLVKARSGRDALKEALKEDFAVILMDVQMPGLNGYETAALIRERERSQYTPIIFLTAYNKTDQHVATGYSVGAIDYLLKPFQPEILKAKVSGFVDLARKNMELEAEVERRIGAEREVLRLNDELEQRVKRRTSQLEAANRTLKREIEERKQARNEIIEHQSAIEALNQRLQRAITETHHRVKNNLQIIAAMVEMYFLDETKVVTAEEARKLAFHIQTLASVHELLTHEAKEDGEAQCISARLVLEKLIEMLQTTMPSGKIQHEIEDMRLSTKRGTSLALVLNELLSNAVKYGDGDIQVHLTVSGNRATLCVDDGGPGFPEGFDPVEAANTGLDLVTSLCQCDLGGEVCFCTRTGGGGSVRVTMPVTA